MKKKNIEVEGGELLIQSKEGHYAVIPTKHRQEVIDMIKDGCDDCINSYIQTLPRESDYAPDGSVYSNNYAKNNFFNRIFKRNQILEKQIMDEYPALYKVGKLRDFKVIEAEGKYKEHLQNTGRNPEYFQKSDGWFPYMDDKNQPLKLKHRGTYRTLVDDDNLSDEQLRNLVSLDYVSHAMRNDETYNNMALDFQNKLYEKYGKDFVESNGGVDAYIRGVISNDEEYEPYKKETEFLGEYINQFIDYLKTE